MESEIQTQTQQKRLNEIIKTNIAPIMKDMGFRRQGRWWGKEEPEYTKSIRIWSSRWNTKEENRFTLELYVYKKHISGQSKKIEEVRIGRLKTGRDNWYELTSAVNLKAYGLQIQEDIEKYATPLFDKY